MLMLLSLTRAGISAREQDRMPSPENESWSYKQWVKGCQRLSVSLAQRAKGWTLFCPSETTESISLGSSTNFEKQKTTNHAKCMPTKRDLHSWEAVERLELKP